MRSDMVPGASLPDYELSDHTGKRRKLSEGSTTATGSSAGPLWKIRHDLRAVTKNCRPDWDITTPELRAAWQQGRKVLFYPYGKTYAQTLGEQD